MTQNLYPAAPALSDTSRVVLGYNIACAREHSAREIDALVVAAQMLEAQEVARRLRTVRAELDALVSTLSDIARGGSCA